MVFDPICRSDIRANDFADFGGSGRAMQTGGDENGDGFPRDTRLFEPGKLRSLSPRSARIIGTRRLIVRTLFCPVSLTMVRHSGYTSFIQG